MTAANVGLPDAAPLQDDYDVVVVGSGGAGLAAALAAAPVMRSPGSGTKVGANASTDAGWGAA